MAQRKTARKTSRPSTKNRARSKAAGRSAKTSGRATRTAKVTKSKSATKGGSGKAASRSKKAADEEVTIDRRRAGRRPEDAQQAAGKPSPAPPLERRKKVNRRRQIDPTTCERDYSDDEVEFMNAIDEYKHQSGRMFPTCSEVLEVVRGLGYLKMSPVHLAATQPPGPSAERHDAASSEPLGTACHSPSSVPSEYAAGESSHLVI